MRTGWLGLGAMGAPMAARPARAGHLVRACDMDMGLVTAAAGQAGAPVPLAAAARLPCEKAATGAWAVSTTPR